MCCVSTFIHAQCVSGTIEGLGTRVVDSCEPPCGYLELSPGSLEEQPELLTAEYLSSLPQQVIILL